MSAPFPLSPAPPSYARCSFPNNRCGVFYPGDTILIQTSNGAATGYTVRDYYGNIITTGTLPTVTPPPLPHANDRALAAVSWFEAVANQDTSPAFAPAGPGTNEFGDSTFSLHWKISASDIQLPSSAAQSFSNTFHSSSGWAGTMAFIKAAGAPSPSVVQRVLGLKAAPSLTTSATVTATSTSNLLVCIVNVGTGSTTPALTVTDNAGNTWTRQNHSDGSANGLESTAIFTTTATNPASITSLTVTSNAVGDIVNFAFYEIVGANNAAPVDLSVCNFGFGAGSVLSTVASTRQFTVPPLGKYGWFRIYLTGPSTDNLFGPSYGATNICLIRDNSNFKRMPAVGVDYATNNGAKTDPAMKAVMGIGATRYEVNNVLDPASVADVRACIDIAKKYFGAANDHPDPLRDQELFVEFPNGFTSDSIFTTGSATSNGGWNVYQKNASRIDGSKLFVTVTPATTLPSGAKLTVYYPDASTVIETFDNLPNTVAFSHVAVDTVNAASNYVVLFTGNDPLVATTFSTPTAIGNTNFNAVKTAVAALYPDVTRFEGPSNEPRDDFTVTVQRMRLFADAVHAGAPGAKAIGPCPVDLNPNATDSTSHVAWSTYLGRGGGAWPDEFSFHDYNSMQNGDLNLGRYTITQWQAINVANGYGSKPFWQTEAGMAFNSVFGVYHPRRALRAIHHVLLWEQYGLPRERNSTWYDYSHGFWSYPAWVEHSDFSLNPQAAIFRVLAEETFAKGHHQALDFGTIGNKIFFGSAYQGADTSSVAVILTTSALPTPTSQSAQAQVVLAVTGTSSPLTYSDPFGNTTVLPVVDGNVTMPVSELPSYLRLPAGVTVTVYACNDWAPIASAIPNLAPSATAYLGGAPTPAINDNLFSTYYPNHVGLAYSAGTMPGDTCELRWASPVTIDHAIVWCGSWWQSDSALVSYDVQTSNDGITWATRASVSKTGVSSFAFGTDSSNAACQRETYADEQWIFDVRFAPITAQRLRILAHTTSNGGEPDAAAVTAGGQGHAQQLVIQEFAATLEGNYVAPSPISSSDTGTIVESATAQHFNSTAPNPIRYHVKARKGKMDPIVSGTLEYVGATVTAKLSGVLEDPTADVVAMAFVNPGSVPADGDWNTAQWDIDATGNTPVYTAVCLVGPGGAIDLDPGEYAVFVKITDSPEVPIKLVPDLLTVT